MAPHSSTLAWKIPWAEEELGRLQFMGSRRVGHDWTTSLSCIGAGNGNPLQCSCLENPRDRGAGGLPSIGLHRVGHDRSNLAAAVEKIMRHKIKDSIYTKQRKIYQTLSFSITEFYIWYCPTNFCFLFCKLFVVKVKTRRFHFFLILK